MPTKRKVNIKGEYITLGQLLKFVGIIGNGGEAKTYLASHPIYLNGELESRRGRKCRPGDVITLDQLTIEVEG